MNAQLVQETKQLYLEALVIYQDAKQTEKDIQTLVLSLYDFPVAPKHEGLNFENVGLIRDPKRTYLMGEKDFQKYLQECHKRYINHKPEIEFNRVYSYEEYKLMTIAQELFLNTVHEEMKHDERYPLTDELFKRVMYSVVKRDKLLELALKLEIKEN